MFCSKQEMNIQQRSQSHQIHTINKSLPSSAKLNQKPVESTDSTDNNKPVYSSAGSASSYFITETKSEIIQLQNTETSSKLHISVRSRSNSSASISKVSPVRCRLNNSDSNSRLGSNENICSTTPKQTQATQPLTIQSPTSNNLTNQSSSPNAKLPPIRHPKSKLIMKNIQNKQHQQQQQQHQQQQQMQLQPAVSTESNISNNQEANNIIMNSLENDFETKNLVNQPSDEKSSEKDVNSKIQRSSSSSVLEKRYIKIVIQFFI